MEEPHISQSDGQSQSISDTGESSATRTGQVQRLYRSRDQRMLLGVCGGLAEYFELDPTIVRVVLAALTLLGGSGILLYVVLAIIMPSEDQLDAHPRDAAKSTLDEAISETRGVANRAANWTRSKAPWSSRDR